MPICLAFLLALVAPADARILLTNPGFEDGLAGWEQHYRHTVEFSIDEEVAHTGARSARCHLDDRADRTGLTARLRLDQEHQTPLLVSVWYRTEQVTGPEHRSFALVVSMEYTTDLEPDRRDDAFIFPFTPGTHAWTELSRIITPRAPIADIVVHCEMKGRTGTAWFDDLSLSVLAEAPLVGSPGDLVPLRWEELPERFAEAMRAPEPEAMVLYARQLRSQDYHLDPLRLLVNYQEREGMQLEIWLALPEGLYPAGAEFDGWEPDFDAVQAGALNGRVVIRTVPETSSGRDAVEFALLEATQELPPPAPVRVPEGAVEIATGDGLALHLDGDGRAVAVSLDGEPMPCGRVGDGGLRGDGGFYLGDLMVGAFEAIRAPVERHDDGWEQHVELSDMRLRFVARYRPAVDHIRVSGEVRDTTGEDRAIDLVYKLPARCEGWRWANALYDEVTVERDGQYQTAYPVASIAAGPFGLCMGVPPDAPARATLGCRPRSAQFHIRYRCGLSAEMSGPLHSCHPFAFVISRCDGEWGWRDAIDRYQALFPEYFAPRCPIHGKWLFQARPNRLPNPEQFAYDEGSYNFEVDDEYGVGSYPYMIPGQREIKRLEELPQSYEEALAAYEAYEIEPERVNEISTRRGWGADLKQIIDTCVATRPDGRRHISIRNTPWGDNSVTFYLNMDPDLFADDDRPAVGARILEHIRLLMAEEPSLDGIYLDSYSSWGTAVDNCRRDHFRYASHPLTYDEATGTPCLVGQWSALEFLDALYGLLHPTHRWVLANMGARLHPFTSMWLDMVGVEGGTRPGRAQVEEFRPVVGRKQLCVLEHERFLAGDDGEISREEYDAFATRCVALGAIPSITWFDGYPELYERNRDLFDLYHALSVRLSKAGWRAVTGARTDAPGVRIERFGPEQDGAVLLTALNRTDEPREATVRLQPQRLGLEGEIAARRLICGGELGGDELTLLLGPGELEVLELRAAPR